MERFDETQLVCRACYKVKSVYIPSGNKVIDDFIKHTLISGSKLAGKMIFVPYDQFKDVKFIAEGGFSKVYKATWTGRPNMTTWNLTKYSGNYSVVLKKLNNSKDITSEKLNELKIFYEFSLNWKKVNSINFHGRFSRFKYVSKYLGITQDPVTKDIMIIMPHYKSGDLINHITNNFYSINWWTKLGKLKNIVVGLVNIHSVNILHRDFHSGNIFIDKNRNAYLGDLGLSKSATEAANDNDNEDIYGIIPYMAPEIFNGQKYTKESDIYSFGMIMWEFMTGRRSFWNRSHDAELIIEIYAGLRPPIVTNAPIGYIELMKECWNSDPNKRPEATYIYNRIDEIYQNEWKTKQTKIISSSDIGPVTNNLGAIYKSRPLSGMIQSAMFTMSTRSLGSQSIIAKIDKRKFDDNQIENSFNEDKIIKKVKLIENENNDYTVNPLYRHTPRDQK